MIELNNYTQHDFLNIEQMHHLTELGVDTSDARYCILSFPEEDNKNKITVFIESKEHYTNYSFKSEFICNTYTLPDLLYKLTEWLGNDGYKGLSFFKDAPFYCFYYDNSDSRLVDNSCVYAETPLNAAYNLLCWCIEHKYSYVENISRKFN